MECSSWIATTTMSNPLSHVRTISLCSGDAIPPPDPLSSDDALSSLLEDDDDDGLRGDSGRRCLGTPWGYSDVRGKRRAPWVAARMIATYSGSRIGAGGAWGCDEPVCCSVAAAFGPDEDDGDELMKMYLHGR